MPAPAALLALLVAAPIAVPPSPSAIGAVPGEAGVFVLPDARILQTVAADADGDGRRELVRLVRGDDDAALAEVWVERGPTWAMLGEPVEVVPPSRVGARIDDVYQATPVRLLVRRLDGGERVTVASQPHFEEIDAGEPCCLLLHDLVIEPGGPARRVAVAEPSDFADSVLVIDLDGDGTDELVSSLSMPLAGEASFPTEARVHRWIDGAFDAPVATTLPAGSRAAPFVLRDSDGLPGDEVAIAATIGLPGLVRIRLGSGDGLVMDPAGLAADQAIAIPLGDGRGIAVSVPDGGLIAAAWPAGEPISAPAGSSRLSDVQLIGTVDVDGEPHLALHRPQTTAALHLLGLPELQPGRNTLIGRSPAAERLAVGPLSPFIGPMPVADPAATNDIAHGGNLIAAGVAPTPMATLAAAQPIGLVGDATMIALHHGPIELAAAGSGGGILAVPSPLPFAWTSIVPVGLVREPEADAGDLEPEISGAVQLERIDDLAVDGDGFTAEIIAPPGSRVVATDGRTVTSRISVVPDRGSVALSLLRGASDDPLARQPVTLVVTTPAGRAYLAAWNVHVRIGPPPVEAEVTTPIGSSAVDIDGVTLPDVTVLIDGRAVEVDADGRFAARVELPPWPTDIVIEVNDSLGNLARATVSGVGWFDYRALPWVPMVAAIVAVAALILLLRVPRLNPLPRGSDDDSALEELEPD